MSEGWLWRGIGGPRCNRGSERFARQQRLEGTLGDMLGDAVPGGVLGDDVGEVVLGDVTGDHVAVAKSAKRKNC
jgi:hypothetical protein